MSNRKHNDKEGTQKEFHALETNAGNIPLSDQQTCPLKRIKSMCAPTSMLKDVKWKNLCVVLLIINLLDPIRIRRPRTSTT